MALSRNISCGPLPGDFGPLQFGLSRLAECRRLAALLGVGAVEEAFELGFGQRKFGRGQGHFLAVLLIVQLEQKVALVDHLALADRRLRNAARQLRTQLDLRGRAFDATRREDLRRIRRTFGTDDGSAGLNVDRHSQGGDRGHQRDGSQ